MLLCSGGAHTSRVDPARTVRPDFASGYPRPVWHRAYLQVERPEGARWDLALQLLKDGATVVVAGVALRVSNHDLHAIVTSAWADPSLVTDETAGQELSRGSQLVQSLLRTDPQFAAVVADREIKLELVADYETGSLLVACLENGALRRP